VCVFLDHTRHELTVQDLEKERDAVKDELFQLTAKYEVKLMKLVKEVIDTKAERDNAIQQQASSNIKVEQLEELKDAIQHTKSGLRFAAAPEKGKSDDVMI